MSITRTVPLENTMAFGGVATGSMKAKDVAMAAGYMKNRGFTSRLSDWGRIKKD